ncbi:uncharacterized protein [Arachis hypogaea]|uniref:uncharacterized protein n=1 Tax=Arachis hypogaea TaxID=3818 RepID=UPI003B20E4F2
MADAPPPTPSELLRMVTELQQANQQMAEENRRMQDQIAQLVNARLEHNNDHHNREENHERRSIPTHVSETPQGEEEEAHQTEEGQPETEEEERDNSAGPFTADIMNFQLPRQFTLPTTLTPYDGLGDPKQHIKKFRSIMIVNGASDPILCRCFPSFLDGPALDWFCSLPADSISRFQELAKQFEDHFVASAIYLHDSDYLTTIKQGPQESLKDYITRFTKVAMRIPDLHPEVHLHAIKSGLRPGKFQETIAVSKPKTLAEFREKAKGQIDVEELRQARKTERSTTAKDDDKPRDNKKTFKPVPRYESYTAFNTKRDDIIKEILNSKLIKPPRKAGTYPESKTVDKSKFCTFHQKHGHTTDECVIAKDLLERLARQGHLDKFIAGRMQKNITSASDPSSASPSSKEKDKAPIQPRGIINCISGGYAGGGHTSSARKRTYRSMLAVTDAPKMPQPTHDVPEMTFYSTDFHQKDLNYDDPVAISVQLGDLIVRKVLLDPGSSADVLFFTTFEKMKLSNNILQPYHGDLVGFSGERVPVLGSVWLQTTLGEQPLFKTQDIQYLVVDCFSPYNLILGRPFLNRFAAIVSTVHLCVKFPVQDNLVATIHGDLHEARQCYNTSLKPIRKSNMPQVNSIQPDQPRLSEIDPRVDFEDRPMPNEDLTKVPLTEDPMKFTFVGTSTNAEEREALITFLRENADLFAWTPADMPGIHPSVITHKLAITPGARPISQKKRNLGTEKRLACLAEVTKLIAANFIREISLVDNSCGFDSLSFMDAYSGYNQILMHPSDQEKTTFITEYGNHCYNVMPFGLKNAGATYQRLMNKVFQNQIGRNIEVYVDDMVAKTMVGKSHINDLAEIFAQIRRYNMRLNPEKCAFGVRGGKFLGFILTSRGIEANPDKCRAIIDMKSPTTLKEVQRLTGRLAALSRFLPCLAILSKPELAGRLIKWAIELSEFDIQYQPRGSVRSQYLADFVAELTQPSQEEKNSDWNLFVDGASNPQGSGAGILLKGPEGINLEHSLRFSFKASNNQAEYEALIAGLRRGFSRPLLKCLDRKKADIALAEAHEGICGIHSGARSLAQKILRAGFYWPTIWKDSKEKVRTCDKCQKHAPSINIPAEQLHQSVISWPFNQWGIDILGPFPTAPKQLKYLVVAIDYFSKWIEAESLARITSFQMISFVWKYIICRYGIPRHVVTDNGRQFTDHNFKLFLQNLKIRQHFSSVEHPQSNGLAEAANKVILHALRKKLDEAKGLWAELIPEILWSYNTTT